MSRVFILRSFLLLLLYSPLLTLADTNKVLVVTNSDQALHQYFIAQMQDNLSALGADNIRLSFITLNQWHADTASHYPLTLALGNKATLLLSQHRQSRPVLFSLVPSTTYQRIMTVTKNCPDNLCSAIYIDQPLKRTLQLVRLAFPQLRTAGFLNSQDSKVNINQLKSIAATQDIKIEHQHVTDIDNLVFNLRDILKKSDALLSLPDPGIYSRHTVQNILLTAYHYRKPVIGYSRAFVRAGALFAVYSTPSQLAQQAAETVAQFFASGKGKLPPPQYPRYFSVSVNNRVAKSLGINLENESALQKKLEALTHE